MYDKKSRSHLGSLIFLLIAALLAAAIVIYRQTIIDYIHAGQYQPSSSAASIRQKLGLTKQGEFYFNASQPSIENASDFNRDCGQNKETNNPILGCYTNQHIYVFDVTNTKLDGIEETTAAHELLHAAYERMNDNERRMVDQEVEAAYERVKTPELEQRMTYYQKSEPGERLNELHSILGTEFANLGPDLEKHYAQYFTNRAQVVAFHDQYSAVFTSAAQQLKDLQSQINSQTSGVNAKIVSYNQLSAALETDVTALNDRAKKPGGFSSEAEFSQARAALVARQNDLTAMRQTIEDEIASINQLREQYNSLVDEYNGLNASINSSLAPAPSL